MMKKVGVVSMVVLLLVAVSGCWGPQKITRQLDDWANQTYVENSWLIGNVISYALLGVAFWVTNFIDGVVLNPIDFWGTSAWPFGKQGHGTPFTHKVPTIPPKK